MGKKKKRNKGKKKAMTCPNNPIGKVKTKYIKGALSANEMIELCDRIQINRNKIIIC